MRQLASVLLKQYVETHWCSYSEKFRPPETTEHAKVTIKELLPHGLKESISKVQRNSNTETFFPKLVNKETMPLGYGLVIYSE